MKSASTFQVRQATALGRCVCEGARRGRLGNLSLYHRLEVFLSKVIQELCAFSCTKREHMFHFSLLCQVDVRFETWVGLW